MGSGPLGEQAPNGGQASATCRGRKIGLSGGVGRWWPGGERMGQSVARLVLPPLLPPGSRGEGRPVLDELVSYGDLMNRRVEDKLVAEEEEEEKKEVVKGQKTLDLNRMPPELAISVLRHLGATDLCLASCVWQQLASDNILWQGLCRSQAAGGRKDPLRLQHPEGVHSPSCAPS